MTKTFLKSTFASVVVAFSATALYVSADNVALQDQYEKSIADAGVIQPNEVKTVATLTAPNGKFVTWTSYPDSYKPGSDLTLAWGETWVTQNGAVQNECKAFAKDEVNLRIQQLLGLPPQDVTQRYFVVLDVKTTDMFRPCANPSLAATECTASFPDDVSESHQAWYASQTAVAYQFPKGYPWPRLGYTYDWNPTTDEEGVSEFVIKKGTTVNVVSLTPTEEYCQ
jgi:hypothetical protein